MWVVTGDGDALSIGGNHLIHALRRNVNLTILLFNNRIYGLTKGQYSPTSEVGKVTKSTPMGSLDHPFNPVSLALGAEATFVGRTMDSDRKDLTDVLRQAAEHQGTALVEIYQNCNIFNDGAFELLKDPTTGTEWTIPLEHGEPLVFGPDGASCVVRDDVRRAADRRDQPGRRGRDRRPRRAPARTRPTRSRCPGCPRRTCGTRRWASSARSRSRPTTRMMAEQLDVARTEQAAGPRRAAQPDDDTWTVRGLTHASGVTRSRRSAPFAVVGRHVQGAVGALLHAADPALRALQLGQPELLRRGRRRRRAGAPARPAP